MTLCEVGLPLALPVRDHCPTFRAPVGEAVALSVRSALHGPGPAAPSAIGRPVALLPPLADHVARPVEDGMLAFRVRPLAHRASDGAALLASVEPGDDLLAAVAAIVHDWSGLLTDCINVFTQ